MYGNGGRIVRRVKHLTRTLKKLACVLQPFHDLIKLEFPTGWVELGIFTKVATYTILMFVDISHLTKLRKFDLRTPSSSHFALWNLPGNPELLYLQYIEMMDIIVLKMCPKLVDLKIKNYQCIPLGNLINQLGFPPKLHSLKMPGIFVEDDKTEWARNSKEDKRSILNLPKRMK